MPRDSHRAHRLGMPCNGFEVALAGAEMENAARELVVADAGAAPQSAQAFPAVDGKPGEGSRIALEASRAAFAQEAQAPAPLRPIGARPEKQRRILAAEPAEDLRHHAG